MGKYSRELCISNSLANRVDAVVDIRNNIHLKSTGTTIPEENTTDLEGLPIANHLSNPQMTSSQSPHPDSFVFRKFLVADVTMMKPAFPVSFEEIGSSVEGVSVDQGGDNLLGLDPFSAAPFNPATIRQHQAAQQKQCQQHSANGISSIASSPLCSASSVGGL